MSYGMRAVTMLVLGLVLFAPGPARAAEPLSLENATFALAVAPETGAIVSLVVKETGIDLIGEKRLAMNFRILLPLPDYAAHYLDGMQQKVAVGKEGETIRVSASGMRSDRGEFPLDLAYTIALDGDTLRFRAKLTNGTPYPVSEFWFPRLGGWTDFGGDRGALLAMPGYTGCANSASIFRGFPGGRGLGAEAAEFNTSYPGGSVMPWWDLYDAKTDLGLYMGYHDETMRLSTWHAYLYPNTSGTWGDAWMTADQAKGEPVGLVFSHVRYPYIKDGETFESGEFVVRLHRGDWHEGSLNYRKWFMEHFPFDKSKSWLRKQSAWFTSILYQPEDKVIADFKTYGDWCRQAQELAGIDTFECIGWHSGGIERNYPEYSPEARLGGAEGWRAMLADVNARGGKCLAFANYNVMDQNTDWYKRELAQYTHQDGYGKTPNWMAWGESTLTARLALNVRRHVLASAVPGFDKVLEDRFVQVAKDGAAGLQLDKVCAGSALDFNPLNTLKPDVALCEGLVQSMKSLLEKCRAVNPDFCMASEAGQDRLIPFVDVFYRNAAGFDIAPLRYVFPEWTACQHVAAPYDFNGVNGAVATGAVICVEPGSYQDTLANPQYAALAAYIKEIGRIRAELADTVFLGNYYDNVGARVYDAKLDPAGGPPTYSQQTSLVYRVHGNRETGRRAIVVANPTNTPRTYFWEFLTTPVEQVKVYEPFQPTRVVGRAEPLTIPAERVQILVAEGDATYPTSLAFRMRCGDAGAETVVAREGYHARVVQAFTSAWGPKWVPPVYHCRADEKEIAIDLTVPKGAKGTLRLYVIDPDTFFGGRREEIFVNGASLGIVENFLEGRWLERPMTEKDTADGKVALRIKNLVPPGNAVVSFIEWVDAAS